MKFPREVWAGSHIKNAPQFKRLIVRSKDEYVNWVKMYNTRMNCYTSVYDFDKFHINSKVDSSVILDRAFLDFDSHDRPLEESFLDVKETARYFYENDYVFKMYFSGKGFHMFVYGDVANDIRQIQSFYQHLVNHLIDYRKNNNHDERPTLDSSGIQTNRLRRNPITMKPSSDSKLGDEQNPVPFYCIPLVMSDMNRDLGAILYDALSPRGIKNNIGNTLVKWPVVTTVEAADVEVEIPKSVGKIPLLPCIHNAIMVENPSHEARVYLIQWYRDILSMGERIIPFEKQKEITQIIMGEIESIAEQDNVWLDWDKYTTLKYVRGIVNGGYNAPGCKTKLIPQGYCIGKCWRYAE